MPVDVDRSATYAAEVAAFDGTPAEEPITFAEASVLVAAVTSLSWWVSTAYDRSPVLVEAAPVAVSSRYVYRTDGAGELRIAAAQRTSATLLHELAHAHTSPGLPGHGHEFRSAYADLVAVVFGAGPADLLVVAFDRHGLSCASPSAPPGLLGGAVPARLTASVPVPGRRRLVP